MRKKNRFTIEIPMRCPYQSCGKSFTKKITIKYETNQRGDMISQRVV